MLLAGGWMAPASAEPHIIRSQGDGRWSNPQTWEGGEIPGKGARVQIRPGHVVEYDLSSDTPIRTIHVAGRLTFATDQDTRLDVGLIRIQAGETFVEEGFDCHMMHRADHGGHGEAALEIGTPEQPIPAEHTTTVRLVHFDGADPMSLPAIVACGGRLDIHGAPMRRTWVKLQQTAAVGETRLFLAEPVADWRAGDRIIITGTNRQRPFAGQSTDHVTDQPTTEE
ncbi:MAG TPA: G8 domain-containing protein, partial [Phycisphaeraceae bacterium]